PLTPNGKVDRKALPLPDPTTIETRSDFGAPRDMLEQQLTQLWRRILAVRHASTVRELAEILRRDGWTPSWSSLVPINPGGSQLPLFLVHGAEGNVLLYRQLARHLGPDQPVYGFQSQGLNGNGSFRASIEEMVSHYVRELVGLQPSGPYRLGGYCLGGAIALEMAQQLQAQGERVSLVAILETYNNNMVSQLKLRGLAPLHLLQNLWFHGANFCLRGNKNRWNFFREKWDTA